MSKHCNGLLSGEVGPAAILDEILGEADALIRERLKDRGFELPCLVIVVTPDGQVVLRGNVSADVLRSFGEDLKNVANELEAPPDPGDTTHYSGAQAVADSLHVLDLRKAGIYRQEFSPDPLHDRANICGVPPLAAAGDEAFIMSRVVDGAVSLRLPYVSHEPGHDFAFHDGQFQILLPPQGARRDWMQGQVAVALCLRRRVDTAYPLRLDNHAQPV